MNNENEKLTLTETEMDRLLRNAPPVEPLADQRREAIWNRIAERLKESSPQDARPRAWQWQWQWQWLRRRSVAWSFGAVVAVGLVFAAIMVTRSHKPLRGQDGMAPERFGQVEVANGRCALVTEKNEEKALSRGDELKAGAHLRVGPDGGLRFRMADGSALWLCSGAEAECVGPRSDASPTMRLFYGEVRAEIAPSSKGTFSIETPGAMLRVKGTQFNCRVLSDLSQRGDENMKRLRSAIQRAIVIVTVLSGAVAVEAAGTSEIVKEGQRTVVQSSVAPAPAEALGKAGYSRKWLGEPGAQAKADTLVFAAIRPWLLHTMWSVDLDTGGASRVADFVGCLPRVSQRFGPDLALVDTVSVLFAHSGDQPIGGNGRPFVKNQITLVDLRSGDKIPMTPLETCDPLYLALSPDRRKLAFVGSQRNDPQARDFAKDQWGVFVLDLETFKVSLARKGYMKTCPHWSPDSRWLAISKGEDYTNKHQIVLIDTATGEVKDTSYEGAGAYFTPDGKSLLFSSGFKKGGSWSAGVPTYGNLFLAALPDGTPEQITQLPDGGAFNPSFSPDGSRLAYWEGGKAKPNHDRLHVMDFASKQDWDVAEGNAFEELRWLNANSRLAFTIKERQPDPKSGEPQEQVKAKLIDLSGAAPAVREVIPQIPAPPPETASQAFADRLYKVFQLYAGAVLAQDLHRLEQAQLKYKESRDLLAAITNELKATSTSLGAAGANQAPRPVALSEDDLAPYLAEFDKVADVTTATLAVKIVHDNLRYYVEALISNYYREKGSLPSGPEELAAWAPNAGWRINHIASNDTERVERLFVIPGNDPNRVKTSYELVQADNEKGQWVLRTPVMPNGKRLVATYDFSAMLKDKHGWPKTEVTEVDSNLSSEPAGK